MIRGKPVPLIRKSRPDEGKRLVDIWRAAVTATHDFLTADDFQAIAAEVSGFLPAAPVWVAVDRQDCAIGFMLVDNGHLEALFVDPARHNQGIGRALVDHALAFYPNLTVDVNEQNAQARGFYQRLGFVPVGRSDVDGQGRPYPLIHLHYKSAL